MPALDTVRIDNKEFALTGPPSGFNEPTLPPAFRQTGVAARGQAIDVPRLVWNNWSERGIGIPEMPAWEHGDHMGSMRDADADTRHVGVVALPHLAQSVSSPSPSGLNTTDTIFNAWATFRNDLYGLFHDTGGTGADQAVGVATFSASGDSYGGIDEVHEKTGQEDFVRGIDLAVHKGELYALYAHEAGDAAATLEDMEYDIKKFNTSWTSASGAGFPSNTEYLDNDNSSDPSYPLGIVLDGPTATRHDLIVALQEDASADEGTIDQTRIYYSDNGGTNWTSLANVPGKPRGKAMWFDPYGGDRGLLPIISTTANVYIVDVANTDVRPILPDGFLSGNDDDGFIAVAAGKLYVGTASGDIQEFAFLGNGILDWDNIGPTSIVPKGGTGIIAARRGPVSWMTASLSFLYVAFKGASYSHILCYNWRNKTWHPFHTYGDTSRIYRMTLAGADDGVRRLHVAVGAGTDGTLRQFEYPDESRQSRVLNTEATGYVEIARLDLGDPHSDGTFIRSRLAADDLGDKDSEYVEHEYGIESAAYDNVSNIGNYVSTDPALEYGRTEQNTSGTEAGLPEGVSGKSIRPRLVLHRDGASTTDSPLIRDWELEARNIYDTRLGWECDIDLRETARQWKRDVEAVVQEITDIINKEKLIPFEWGKSGVKYLFPKGEHPSVTAAADLSTATSERRGGVFRLRLVEGIPSG